MALIMLAGCNNGKDDPRDHVGKQDQHGTGNNGKVNAVNSDRAAPTVRNVTLKTDDHWDINGDYYSARGTPVGAVIMLHQRNGGAGDWRALCEALAEAGIASIAIDQRGSGRSKADDNVSGNNAPWDTQLDIDACYRFLIKENRTYEHHLGIAGASYGANNALIYGAKYPDRILALSLFSPGTDYNNLDAITPAKKWLGPIFFFYSLHDPIAGLGPEQIRDNCSSRDKESSQHDDDKHGTELLDSATIDSNVVFFTRTLK